MQTTEDLDDVRKNVTRVYETAATTCFRSFRMVGRIVANGCTHVPDEKQEHFVQIASSSNGAQRKERFECGSNTRFVMIKYRKLQVLLVGFLSWRPGG